MGNTNDKSKPEIYSLSKKENWFGRITEPGIGIQYWHQAICLEDINAMPKSVSGKKPKIAIIGYACDEGVRRNQGRIGAKEGPSDIRKRLGKLPFHLSQDQVIDVGDYNCIGQDLESCQFLFSEAISKLLHNNMFPIGVGGGHDIASAHFTGIRQYLLGEKKKKIGVINFDAHFDLRPNVEQKTSGTPFHEILSKYGNDTEYLVLGIQKSANTKELFELAHSFGVKYLLNYECQLSNLEKVKSVLSEFLIQNDLIYLTIDLDGFSSAYAPGVSAPSPLGFTPYFVLEILTFLMDSKKVVSCDIAEANPLYDLDFTTVNLAARLIDHLALCYLSD